MSTPLYLFLPANEQGKEKLLDGLPAAEVSWVYRDVNHDLKLASGLLEDAAKAALNKTVNVVLPGEDVLSLSATVPGKNLQQVQQAVPYVLEDSVIDDVEELHFAIRKKSQAENQYEVAVIDEQYFKSIVSQLEQSGIQADSIIADYHLLPPKTLLSDGARLLYQNDEAQFSLQSGRGFKLTDLGLNESHIDKLVNCGSESGDNPLLAELSKDIEAEDCSTHPYLYLIENMPGNPGVNLLQGVYRKKKNWSKTGKTWMPAAAVFLVWIVVQGVMFIFDYVSLSSQNKKLNEQMVQIYKSTFPTGKKVYNPRDRMESQLLALKKHQGASGRGFTEMLSGSAAIFARTPGLKIKTLRYYDGRINLELNIASLQALDKLKLQLINEKGYQVEIQNASAGKENVTARMQITGAVS